VLGFILFIGAYLAEDVRAGLRSVRQGQIDAALALGVTEFTGAALLVNAREFQPVPILLTVALTYLMLCYGLSLVGRMLYGRFAVRS
jgi:ABC-type amino acid transport system permease subunit